MGVPDRKAQQCLADSKLEASSGQVHLPVNDWWASQSTRLAVLEFDRSRKSMSALVKSKGGETSLLVKVSKREGMKVLGACARSRLHDESSSDRVDDVCWQNNHCWAL